MVNLRLRSLTLRIVLAYPRIMLDEMKSHWYTLFSFLQCSIEPRQSFTYRFLAQPSGTHWYHSHLHNQRLDGLYGAFIIHKSIPKIQNFPFLVTDWFHEQATTLEITNPFSLNIGDKGKIIIEQNI